MAVTRLERKGRKNKSRAKARVNTIKRLSGAPVIKKVDVEAIKAEFDKKNKPKEAVKSEEKAKVEVVKEEKVEAVVEAPVAVVEAKEEKKPAPKKKAAKKKTEE